MPSKLNCPVEMGPEWVEMVTTIFCSTVEPSAEPSSG